MPRLFWMTVAAALILTLGGVSWPIMRRIAKGAAAKQAQSELVKQQRLAQSEGIALSPKELIPSVPEAQNAAPLYIEAGNQLVALNGYPAPVDGDRAANEAARAILTRARPTLALLDEAVALPYCQSHPKFTINDYSYAPPMKGMRMCAKFTAGEAILQANDGHPVEALETLAKRGHLCGHMAQSPILIDALIQVACQSIFQSAISKILTLHGREPEVPEAAAAALRALGPSPDLDKIAQAKNLIGLSALEPGNLAVTLSQLAEGLDLTADDSLLLELHRVEKLSKSPENVDRWRAYQWETTRSIIATLRRPHTNQLDLENELAAIGQNPSQKKDDAQAWERLFGSSSFPATVDALARTESMNRVLLQACAVFEAWNNSGSLPKTLLLSGADAEDPFTSKPLNYSTTTTGFKIYGVGMHGIDHGGTPPGPPPTFEGYDMVFEYVGL